MKLSQLQEARYAHGKYVEWVFDNWDVWPTNHIEIEENQLEDARKQLSRVFGQHKHYDEESIGQYWFWEVDNMKDKARNVVLYRSDSGELCELSLSANTGSI